MKSHIRISHIPHFSSILINGISAKEGTNFNQHLVHQPPDLQPGRKQIGEEFQVDCRGSSPQSEQD
jgi:hypothetical protein